MPPLQSSTGILPRYAVIMGRLNTRQAAKAGVGEDTKHRMANHVRNHYSGPAKTGVGEGIKLALQVMAQMNILRQLKFDLRSVISAYPVSRLPEYPAIIVYLRTSIFYRIAYRIQR